MNPRTSSLHGVRTSRCMFSWESPDLHEAGLVARTGQIGVLARASATTATDRNGNSRAVAYHQPAVEMLDLDEDDIRETPSLLTDADLVAWPVLFGLRDMEIYVRFIEVGTIGTSGAGLIYLGNDAVSGARLFIQSNGTHYVLSHHNGTSAVTSTAAAAPTAGQLVELVATFNADGSVQLTQAINAGNPASATASAAHTPAAAWGATTKLRANSTGTGGTTGETAFLALRVMAGTGYTLQHFREQY
jgi:hypothetical protein